MSHEFERSWSELNQRLRWVEREAGLTGALDALKHHQRRSGFIADGLEDVERHEVRHPEEPSRFFRVQYNPTRALRFAGKSMRRAPADGPLGNGGCFLCRDNIRRQQQGTQLGYEIRVGDTHYVALMNPFPLLPSHVVMAAREHRPQDWPSLNGGGFEVSGLLHDVVTLADRMPGYIGFYNGVDAGASIPGHLHFHFARRPEDGPDFPLERAAENTSACNGRAELEGPYPLPVALWKGTPDDVVDRASSWVADWGERNRARLNGLSANLIATRQPEDDRIALYFVPRDRSRPRAKGLSGMVGGLEVLGEIVLSSPEEKGRLDDGLLDYFALESSLASVRTPFFKN